MASLLLGITNLLIRIREKVVLDSFHVDIIIPIV